LPTILLLAGGPFLPLLSVKIYPSYKHGVPKRVDGSRELNEQLVMPHKDRFILVTTTKLFLFKRM
jgi:hypothetical protein